MGGVILNNCTRIKHCAERLRDLAPQHTYLCESQNTRLEMTPWQLIQLCAERQNNDLSPAPLQGSPTASGRPTALTQGAGRRTLADHHPVLKQSGLENPALTQFNFYPGGNTHACIMLARKGGRSRRYRP